MNNFGYIGLGAILGGAVVLLIWLTNPRKTINLNSHIPEVIPEMPIVSPPRVEERIVLEKNVIPNITPIKQIPSEKTVEQKIADTSLPLIDRLNLRYTFADAKFSPSLKILSWKNYAGKRMQGPFTNTFDPIVNWKNACTLIEDSLHDIR